MKPTTIFSTKAEKYAKYRWGYAPQAVQAIIEITQIGPQSILADLGAGTGILTRHFIGKAGKVIAIEPNREMRQIAERQVGTLPGCRVIDGLAEATGLPSASVDVITVATAFNWFDPRPTLAEFTRILKPGGWLVNLNNHTTAPDFGPAMANLYPRQTDTHAIMKGAQTPLRFYFDEAGFQQLSFPIRQDETWEQFLGACASVSYAPDEDHPLYDGFEQRARAIFDAFCQNGLVTVHGMTDVTIGHVANSEQI